VAQTREPPSYIPAELIGAPIEFPWEGRHAHAGPMQVVTRLLDHLASTTTCGQLVMCAGIVEWGTWRLSGHVPLDTTFDRIDASFAYQVDQRYADYRGGESTKPPPDASPALAALRELNSYLWASMGRKYAKSYYQPVPNTFHAAHVVRHILPKQHKKTFNTWLHDLAIRVRAVAPKPDEEFKKKKTFETPEAHAAFLARHWGAPLSRAILDPEADASDPSQASRFAASLDWEANPLLRSPEQMRELGFEGTPYTS